MRPSSRRAAEPPSRPLERRAPSAEPPSQPAVRSSGRPATGPNPQLVARLAGPLVSWLARSWRIELRGAWEAWQALEAGGRPYVLLAWHEALLPLLWQHRDRGMTIVVSEAREGRYLSAYARRLGYREARGSSTRGGVRALIAAIRALRRGGSVAFTPDGPRGPRRAFKGGVLLAAQRGGAPIVPVHAGADRAWRLKSWDRMLIPKPFARVRIAYEAPFEVERVPGGLEAARARASAELERAVSEAHR
ncbi:MAG: lysophospholipid acyltransferase family protein [Gemmatimonadales bacterium]